MKHKKPYDYVKLVAPSLAKTPTGSDYLATREYMRALCKNLTTFKPKTILFR
jgi:hypothetical protein